MEGKSTVTGVKGKEVPGEGCSCEGCINNVDDPEEVTMADWGRDDRVIV